MKKALWALTLLVLSSACHAQQLYRDEIIVKYKDAPSAAELAKYRMPDGGPAGSKEELRRDIERRYGLTGAKKWLPEKHFSVYRVRDRARLKAEAGEISSMPGVEYAEPNYLRKAFYAPLPWPAPNDPRYQGITPAASASQWGYNRVRADRVYYEKMIDPALNRTVAVAVLDGGLYAAHEDMQGTSVNGWNFVSGNADTGDDGITLGHGTHVSSIIAANTNNRAGIAGAAFISGTAKVLVMPVKVVAADGYADDAVIYAGLVWAADNGARVINMSLGGAATSNTLLNGINYADSKGCLMVAAAGNDNVGTYYPAAYPKVMSIAATGTSDGKAGFSNYGKIDMAAPGVDIDSAGNNGPSYYNEVDGTSFAAPFVAAAAALVMLQNPLYTASQVRSVLEQSAEDLGAAGYDEVFGWGMLNMYRALTGDFSSPASGIRTYNWPNPFNPVKDTYTNITVFLEEPSGAVIEIFDSGGALVWKKEVDRSVFVSGQACSVAWDGTNMEGKAAGNGVYFYTVRAGGKLGKNKIAVVR